MFNSIIRSLTLRIGIILTLDNRTFGDILKNHCYWSRSYKALFRVGFKRIVNLVYGIQFAVRHLHVKLKLDFLASFEVQLFRILHADRIVAHHERNFIIRIVNGVFHVTEPVKMKFVGIISNNHTDGVTHFKHFLRMQNKFIRSPFVFLVQINDFFNNRLFVHVNNIDDTINGSREAIFIRNGELHIVSQVI